jgi:hypothetical protein
MTRAAWIFLILALALAVAGCGGGGKRTIPTAKAESMLRQLDNVRSQFDAQACSGTHAKVTSLEAQARALPRSVDAEVKRNLVAGLARLDSLVQRDCQKPPPPQTNTQTTPTVPTTPTETTPTNTVPTTPTNTVPTNTTPTTPNTTPTNPGGGGGVTVPGGTTGAGGAQLGGGGNGGGKGSG